MLHRPNSQSKWPMLSANVLFICCNNPIIRIHNFKFEEIKIERLLSQTIITLKLCKVEVPNSQRLVVIMQYKLERQLW